MVAFQNCSEEPISSSSLLGIKAGNSLKSNSKYAVCAPGTKQAHAWFDVKVFYVRVSCCLLNESPDSLLISYPPRDHTGTELEVNGGRISPSERACLTLRRDRIDTESSEATYVSTNNIRTTGSLTFDIFDKDDLLLCGNLGQVKADPDDNVIKGYNSSLGTSPMSSKTGWSMDCYCAISSPTCSFLKGRVDFSAHRPASMEVYIAGRSSGLPIVLTQTVLLAARRRNFRCSTLDAIPEQEESQPEIILAKQIAEDIQCAQMIDQSSINFSSNFYGADSGYLEGEEGDLSWFNAGVRVGVGIGLGMCLGIGIGVGLLVRAYQTTTRPFRRRLF